MKTENQKNILLVEDDSVTAIIETALLNKYGFKVIAAKSGEEAVEIVSGSTDIDLILMDINLGEGMDGTEAAEIILEKRDIPLIFLSSHTEVEIVEKTEGITSYGYIVKNSGETVIIVSIKMAFRLFESRLLEKRKEEALCAERNFNKTLVELSPAFFVAISSDGKVIMMNKSMLNALGYTFDEISGKNYINTLVPESDRAGLSAVFDKIINDNKLTVNVNRIKAKDGGVLIVEWQGIPVFQGDTYNFFLGVGIDITARVRAEEKAREHAVFRNRVFESSKLPIIVIDAESYEYIDCNMAAVEIYGFSNITDVLGKKPIDMSAPFQYDGSCSMQKAEYYINSALNEGFIIFEWRHRRPNGVMWDAEVHLMSFTDNGKKYLQFMLIDITARKNAERELAESKKELESSEKNSDNYEGK